MAKPSLFSLCTITFVLFLSLIAYSYPLPILKLPTDYSAHFPGQQNARATFDDVLNLLGTSQQAASVDPLVAQQLKSCFKYLVPPPDSAPGLGNDDYDQIWFPPEAVLELVRLAIESGGDPQTIVRALDPTPIQVPDVEGSTAARCELTRRPSCQRFVNSVLNDYMKFLLNLVVKQGPSIGLNAALNRFDLFHGHLVLTKDSRIGILFHAKEYPVEIPGVPYQVNCQKGSTLSYDVSQMNLRNILWLAPYIKGDDWVPGTLLVLDARPDGIVYANLITEVKPARTIYEGNFGTVVVEPNYLNVGTAGAPNYQLFMC